MTLFFYTRQVDEETFTTASFNIDLVTQTVETPTGQMLISLGDWHVEPREFDIPLKNGGKRTEVRDVDICSTIVLNKEDADRFKVLYNKEGYVSSYKVATSTDTLFTTTTEAVEEFEKSEVQGL